MKLKQIIEGMDKSSLHWSKDDAEYGIEDWNIGDGGSGYVAVEERGQELVIPVVFDVEEGNVGYEDNSFDHAFGTHDPGSGYTSDGGGIINVRIDFGNLDRAELKGLVALLKLPARQVSNHESINAAFVRVMGGQQELDDKFFEIIEDDFAEEIHKNAVSRDEDARADAQISAYEDRMNGYY
jgi:hypothetical protein